MAPLLLHSEAISSLKLQLTRANDLTINVARCAARLISGCTQQVFVGQVLAHECEFPRSMFRVETNTHIQAYRRGLLTEGLILYLRVISGAQDDVAIEADFDRADKRSVVAESQAASPRRRELVNLTTKILHHRRPA